jgi:hypothetical protein
MKKINTKYITLHFPLLHIDVKEREQYDKVIEEYNEFRKELFAESDVERMLHELQDVVQAYLTLLVLKAKTFSIDNTEASERVAVVVEQANQDHRKKIERYKADRGWE